MVVVVMVVVLQVMVLLPCENFSKAARPQPAMAALLLLLLVGRPLVVTL